MSTRRGSVPGDSTGAVNGSDGWSRATKDAPVESDDARTSEADFAARAGSARKKRRRQRPQRAKNRGPRPQRVADHDAGGRERIFQDIEGLLRQVREQAEEFGDCSQEQLAEITQAVTGFTRLLEEESDPVSERARGDYQRLRERLIHALKR